MADGALLKKRLEKVTKELDTEVALWNTKGWDASQYRIGSAELYVRCEVIAIYKVLKDKLGITEDEFTIYLRQAVLDQMKELRRVTDEAESAAIRKRLTDGIHIVPPKNLKPGEL